MTKAVHKVPRKLSTLVTLATTKLKKARDEKTSECNGAISEYIDGAILAKLSSLETCSIPQIEITCPPHLSTHIEKYFPRTPSGFNDLKKVIEGIITPMTITPINGVEVKDQVDSDDCGRIFFRFIFDNPMLTKNPLQ